ncbi:helix-turn-helix transcriptional regulator [Sphingosinicella sp.]|uniref:helix-turn-helix transcriptional regulator n=1 Tax=Sphingosinicella sp. TaxID=1917971 RepID=UPI0040382A3F
MDLHRDFRADDSELDPTSPAAGAPRTERRELHSSEMLSAEDFSIRNERNAITGYTPNLQLALPYRGLFDWNVGRGRTLVDANQLLLIAGDQTFVEHQPVAALGHSCIILTPQKEALAELMALSAKSGEQVYTDIAIPASRNIRMLLQQWLRLRRGDQTSALELDELAVATFREALRIVPSNRAYPALLVARAKELLHELVSEPLSLQQLADALGVSPAYLTQTFSRAEGVPLYRYQLHLRLARAMVELPGVEDITALALDLGFSSHSHFTTAFKAFARQTPSDFRQAFRPRTVSLAGAGRRKSAQPPVRHLVRPAEARTPFRGVWYMSDAVERRA